MQALLRFFSTEAVTESGIPCWRLLTDNHTIDLHVSPSRSEEMVVTFDHMSFARQTLHRDREGWGFRWLARQGFNVLSVKPQGNDWYRDESLRAVFRAFYRDSAFAGFRRTIFYGGSMGGFGALVFAAAAPGATIIAMNPQSTLDPAKVPWEHRFPEGTRQNWEGDFADGAAAGATAGEVAIFYDPHDIGDRRHAERIAGGRVGHFHIPFVGHGIPAILNKMGVLQEMFTGVLNGTLTPAAFAPLARRRKLLGNHWLCLAQRRASPRIRAALLERGMQADPMFPGCHVARTRDLIRDGALDDAERVIRAAHARFRFNAETLSALSDVLIEKGALPEALDFAQRAADREPHDPRGQLRLARIQLALGEPDRAAAHASAAIETAHNWPGVHFAARRLLRHVRQQGGKSASAG